MEQLDRLFGQEISNFSHLGLQFRQKNKSITLGQKVRGISIDESKVHVNKIYKEEINPNISHRVEKVSKEKENPKEETYAEMTEYYKESLSFMRAQQDRNFANGPSCTYMSEQTEINANMRGILLDWIVDNHFKFKMFPQTLYIVAAIIDRYLSIKNVSKDKLQLIGAAAFFIAAKYEETYRIPELNDLIHLSAKAFSKQQLLKAEADIVKTLDFNLIFDTSFKFLEPFSKLAKLDEKRFFLAQYVLELSIIDIKFLKFKPSLLAASAIYLINKIRKVNEVWPSSVAQVSGYDEKDLRSAAKELCNLLENTESTPNIKCLKRKFGLPKFYEVSKIRLERKEKH